MAKAKESKPWQQEGAGRYRASDSRFVVEQQSAGRWFVSDNQQLDELGLPRIAGPFPSMIAARAEAEEMRTRPAPASPLDARRRAHPASVSPPPARRATPPKPPPPPPTWLDRLPPDTATRARRMVADLERIGFDNAEALVRQDVASGVPAVAQALLARRLQHTTIEPWEAGTAPTDPTLRDLIATLIASGAKTEDVRQFAIAIARQVTRAAAAAMSSRDIDPDSPSLPGWQLVETNGASEPGRPLRVKDDTVG